MSYEYTIVAKVDAHKFIRWQAVTDLVRCWESLYEKYPSFRYMNVFYKGDQIDNYTRKTPPTSKFSPNHG